MGSLNSVDGEISALTNEVSFPEMVGFLLKVDNKAVYTWHIPNYTEAAAKKDLKSNRSFLEDGSGWTLELLHGVGVCMDLNLQTKELVSVPVVDSVAWHAVKQDGSVIGIGLTSGHTFQRDRSFVRVRCERQELNDFLQADGSLCLQCHITLGAPPMVSGPANLAKLRETGMDSDFLILSPGGKEFKVSA